jgi:hypothetical protein
MNVLHSQTNSQVLSTDGQVPIRLVTINGIPFWQASGRTFPVVAGAEDPPPDDAHTEDDDSGDGEIDKDRFNALRAKLRDEAKAARLEAKAAKAEAAALRAKEQERADADKSELEKAQLKLAAAEKAHEESQAKLRRTLITQAIERAATKHNARDAEVVAKLIDMDALEIDADGSPTNADQLVKDLLKDKSYLVASEEGNTGRSGVPPTPRSSGAPKREDKVREAEEKLIATRQYQPIG